MQLNQSVWCSEGDIGAADGVQVRGLPLPDGLGDGPAGVMFMLCFGVSILICGAPCQVGASRSLA